MTLAKNAFTSLDHNLLLGMMESFGATKQVTTIIKHYLKKRSQFVQIEAERSSKWSPEAGIYAGSVLSGVLFNIGTASQIINKPYMTKFADDSGARVKEPTGNVSWEQAVKYELLDQLNWYGRANFSPAIQCESKEDFKSSITEAVRFVLPRIFPSKMHCTVVCIFPRMRN